MNTTNSALLASVLEATAVIIDGVKPDQKDLPTPCDELDVGALVNHLVGWLHKFTGDVTGEPWEHDPDTYKADGDPTAEFRQTSNELIDGLGHPEETAPPIGMLLLEFIVHGWDLATATNQPVPFTDDEVRPALKFGQAMIKPEFRGEGKFFGDEVSIEVDAAMVDQLVAFVGRQPK